MRYDKTEMNAFVQSLYDAKMAEGKHGHYETIFHVVHKAIERATTADARPVGELTTCNCRWNGEEQVQSCTLHAAHVDAIHEWAERAKTAESELAAARTQPDAPLTLGQIAIEELLQLGYTIEGGSFKRNFYPQQDRLANLVSDWEERSREASPVDAMLINKCIRELREVAKELQK